jgi:hypothetical protein
MRSGLGEPRTNAARFEVELSIFAPFFFVHHDKSKLKTLSTYVPPAAKGTGICAISPSVLPMHRLAGFLSDCFSRASLFARAGSFTVAFAEEPVPNHFDFPQLLVCHNGGDSPHRVRNHTPNVRQNFYVVRTRHRHPLHS